MYRLRFYPKFLIFVIFLYSTRSTVADSSPGCKSLFDFCIVLDASDSIQEYDFQTLRNIVRDLIDQLQIGDDDDARMGIIVYSSAIAMEVPLTSDKQYLHQRAATMPHPRQGTETSLAINKMRDMFSKYGRQGVPAIGMVVTDGISLDPDQTTLEAKLTRDMGVNMFSVGVTNLTDDDELYRIASSRNQVFHADTFNSLAFNIQKLAKMVCPTPTTVKPTTPMAPTTTLPPPSTIKPIKGICDGCKMSNGVGFNPHPDDCDKFVQCYFGAKNEVLGMYRQCPFGQFWDQKVLTCRLAEMVPCKNDKCQYPGLLSYPHSGKGSCRTYWKCNFGKAIGMCCPPGYSYVPFKFCVENPDCKDECPPRLYHQYHQGACDTRMIFGRPDMFEQYVLGHGWVKMPCAFGTRYDPNTCLCAFHDSLNKPRQVCEPELKLDFDKDCEDVGGKRLHVRNDNVNLTGNGLAFFDGKSKLVIPRFSNFQHYSDIYIKIRYFGMPSYEPQALLSNGDCCDNSASIMLIKTEEDVNFAATTEGNQTTVFSLPANPGNWNDVIYIHDNKKLEGKANNVITEDWAMGPLQTTAAGLQIGFSKGYQNFHGYMDYVYVYLCRPEY